MPGDFRIHFGLGTDTKADLTVRWPDGKVDTYRDLLAGNWVTVLQGRGILRTRKLAALWGGASAPPPGFRPAGRLESPPRPGEAAPQ